MGSLNIRELSKQTTQFCFDSLTARFNSLEYKGEAVRVKESASTDDIAILMMVLDCIDPDIDWTDTTLKKVKVMERPLVRSFFAKHVRGTQYCFQFKKCRDDEFVFQDTIHMDEEEFSSVHWLPMPSTQAGDADSYKKFASAFSNHDPSDEFRPGGRHEQERAPPEFLQANPTFKLVSGRARYAIFCTECDLPRVLFSKKTLSDSDVEELKEALEACQYSCGGPFIPPEHAI